VTRITTRVIGGAQIAEGGLLMHGDRCLVISGQARLTGGC